MHLISPVYARFVLRELTQRGIPEQPLFAGTSLNRDTLETGGDISMLDFSTFLENARNTSGDEQLGLMIGRKTSIAVLGSLGAAIIAAPTVREGLQMMESYSRLHVSYIEVELISNLRGMSVRFLFEPGLGETERFHAETAAMLLQNYMETVTGAQLSDAQYRFFFTQPDYAGQYTYYLHSPIVFSCENTSVEITHQWLDLKSPYFDKEAWNQAQLLLARRIKELVDNQEDTYTKHLSAILRSYEPPLPDLTTVAQKLHLSERTLNRRLQHEDTSFREIRSRALNAWAAQYLLETNSTVESIAYTLGYKDTANFRRAFRTWEACSPSDFRKQNAI